MLDKDGGRDVAWEVIFRLKKVVLLKILYNWLLGGRKGVVEIIWHAFILYNAVYLDLLWHQLFIAF